MSKESGAAENLTGMAETEVTEQQVAEFLHANPEFFLNRPDLLAELTLPHQSGEAVSLLERQVSVLRERSYHANAKLGNLLENASKNDQLFEVTRKLVLNLLGAKSIPQLASVVCDTITRQENIDSCQLILSDSATFDSSEYLQIDPALTETFADVFRLRHTHCGQPAERQLELLYGKQTETIMSTALCPIMVNDTALGILAIGSEQSNYFNVNLDTLFLDFIGHVIAAVLEDKLTR